MSTSKKAILAFGGGLDTSVAVKYLSLEYGLETIFVQVVLQTDGWMSRKWQHNASHNGSIKTHTHWMHEVFARLENRIMRRWQMRYMKNCQYFKHTLQDKLSPYTSMKTLKVGIIGASGYVGETIRLLVNDQKLRFGSATSRKHAGVSTQNRRSKRR